MYTTPTAAYSFITMWIYLTARVLYHAGLPKMCTLAQIVQMCRSIRTACHMMQAAQCHSSWKQCSRTTRWTILHPNVHMCVIIQGYQSLSLLCCMYVRSLLYWLHSSNCGTCWSKCFDSALCYCMWAQSQMTNQLIDITTDHSLIRPSGTLPLYDWKLSDNRNQTR